MIGGLLPALLTRERPIGPEAWRVFWDRLAAGALKRGEAAAVLASLSTAMPDGHTLTALFDTLDERRQPWQAALPGAVNVVGTGGGPRTFNVSTAAALVAAVLGVPVVKTGSRGFSSRYGSVDLLDHLGVPRTGSAEETAESLAGFGVAFAGDFAYPAEIAMLAKAIVPLDLRAVGPFVNAVGPFLADLPVTAQVTGVSSAGWLPALAGLASRRPDRRIWLCHNGLGVDELLGFTDNVIVPNTGEPIELRALAVGDLADLRPSADVPAVRSHFLDVLVGRAAPAAVDTVCLNAAALAVAGGLTDDWDAAVAAARTVVRDGGAVDLVHRLRGAADRDGRLASHAR